MQPSEYGDRREMDSHGFKVCTAPRARGTPTEFRLGRRVGDIARSTYLRWKKLLKENADWVAQRQIRIQSTAPKRNGMSLSDDWQKRIVDMASSGIYTNPRQIAKALDGEGKKASDNAVRDNLERAGLYGLETVTGSNGKPIKKKVIRSLQAKD